MALAEAAAGKGRRAPEERQQPLRAGASMCDSSPSTQAAARSGGMALLQSATTVLSRGLNSSCVAAVPSGRPLHQCSQGHRRLLQYLRLPQAAHNLCPKFHIIPCSRRFCESAALYTKHCSTWQEAIKHKLEL